MTKEEKEEREKQTAPKMRDLKKLNFYELEALKILINNYKIYKRTEDDLHYIFANSIYTLIGLETSGKFRLKNILTDEFIEQINQLSKTAKK